MVVVGVFIFMQNPVTQIRRNRAGKSDPWQDFMSMTGITLANFVLIIPYIFIFFGLFSVQSSDEMSLKTVIEGLLMIAGFATGAVGWWFLLTSLISLFRRKFRPRHLLWINRIAGVVIIILGFYTVIATFIRTMS